MRNLLFTVLIAVPMMNLDAQNTNPLLNDWKGKYGGVPAFSEYKVSQFRSAVDVAIADKLREIDVIATLPTPPSFENTIAAMERSGKRLSRIKAIFDIYSSNLNTPEFEAVEADITPKFSEVNNQMYQNKKLFDRIAAVYKSAEMKKLTPEQKRLVTVYYQNFVREGALADPKSKTRIFF